MPGCSRAPGRAPEAPKQKRVVGEPGIRTRRAAAVPGPNHPAPGSRRWAVSGGVGRARLLARDGLDRLESLELRVPEIERLRRRHPAMGLAELLGPGPGLEIGLRAPDRVRRVEDVVLVLGPAQQLEL